MPSHFAVFIVAAESSSDDDSSVFDATDSQAGSVQGLALSPTPSAMSQPLTAGSSSSQQQQGAGGRQQAGSINRHSSDTGGSTPALASNSSQDILAAQAQRASAIYANVSIPSGPGRDSRGLDVLPVARQQCKLCASTILIFNVYVHVKWRHFRCRCYI